MRTLLLGEALLDLVAERPAATPSDVDALVPHPGGTGLTTATVAATRGARVALAGGVGDDDWGRWLRDGLEAAGVALDHFLLVPALRTPVALVTVDGDGLPRADVRGTAVGPALVALGERVMDAVDESDALCLSSQTLVGTAERELTLAARDRALELGMPVVFDPALRPTRWANRARAVTEAREAVRGAFLVKVDRADARLLTGEDDPVKQADALLAGGAEHVVVSLGPGAGALLRGGGFHVRVPPRDVGARVVDRTGAGDVLTGVLLAELAQSDFYPSVLAAGLREAVALSERALGAHGADAWR